MNRMAGWALLGVWMLSAVPAQAAEVAALKPRLDQFTATLRALLRVWLGDHPAQDRLKAELLGRTE